jgi:hypothetical protein
MKKFTFIWLIETYSVRYDSTYATVKEISIVGAQLLFSPLTLSRGSFKDAGDGNRTRGRRRTACRYCLSYATLYLNYDVPYLNYAAPFLSCAAP